MSNPMCLFWLVVYAVLASVTIVIVRKAGPDAMDTRYVIEEEYDRETGPKNVAYRILAPMLQRPCSFDDNGGRLRFDPFAAMEGSSPCYILVYTWRN